MLDVRSMASSINKFEYNVVKLLSLNLKYSKKETNGMTPRKHS